MIIQALKKAKHYVLTDLRRNNIRKCAAWKIKRGKLSATYCKKEVVCVATSIPQRLAILPTSIKSILYQSVRPDKIVIYLGKELFKEIELPSELIALEKYGVEFRSVHDVRVHTKYYYAFQEFPHSYVMTFDDDIVYHPNLLKKLLKASEKHPDCIISSRCHKILGSQDGKFALYNNWDWECYLSKPTHMLMPTGVGGVLYRPELFPDETYDSEAFLNMTPNNDDLWLKYIELIVRLPALIIKPSWNKWWHAEIENSQTVSLQSDNVFRNRNDVYWIQLMQQAGISYNDLLGMEGKLNSRE